MRLHFGLLAVFVTAVVSALAASSTVEVVNHHPFSVRQPFSVAGSTVVAEVGARSSVLVSTAAKPRTVLLSATPQGGGLELTWQGASLGRMSWDLLITTADRKAIDYAGGFTPLPLQFKQVANAPLYADWQAKAQKEGLSITIAARVFRDGFFDTEVSLQNISSDRSRGVYVAAIARWEHPPAGKTLLCYDNRMEDFDGQGRTRFSVGEGRHWSLQHGIDWLALSFGNNSATILNSYSESPTVLDDVHSVKNKSPRFTGANIPQFKNEAQVNGNSLYLVTEFARSNTPYRDRFVDNIMPARGQTLVNRQRIQFGGALPTSEAAGQAFVAYNSFSSRSSNASSARIELGVPDVIFGTSYFPYSTLGENFGELKMPGQQTDAFWPLSADTVTHWKDFADDIRRDLRIAKAMGFTVIRLHYVDLIAKLPEPLQYEYLDFLFAELRHLKLRAMFSTAFTNWTPEELAARVGRYKDVIDRLELENEILIWGIPLDRPQYWSRIYSEVKKVAPNVQVHYTSHLNTGIFDRLELLRVKSDVISAHSYIDSPDAIPSGRGFALAVGSYATMRDKTAIYTEWNWRGFTRMTPEARAAVYPPIMENLLATRSIREMYQFQMQQTMCVNPHTRKGIRQYEPLWLSRRPKPEGLILMELIDRYSSASSPNRVIAANRVVVEVKADSAAGVFRLESKSPAALKLALSMEGPLGVKLKAPAAITLTAGKPAEVPFQAEFDSAALPGFYHIFLRMEAEGGLVRYAWAEIRKPGQPAGATFPLDRPLAVVYGEGAPNIELEAGYLLAATIESASGRPVKLFSAQDLTEDVRSSTTLILVGSAKTNKLVPTARSNWLVLKDYDASVDFALSYWKQSKDSAARRTGLVKKNIPAGADVANLP